VQAWVSRIAISRSNSQFQILFALKSFMSHGKKENAYFVQDPAAGSGGMSLAQAVRPGKGLKTDHFRSAEGQRAA
jgi:hypothetical protein